MGFETRDLKTCNLSLNMFVDAHLDLAFSAQIDRNPARSLEELRGGNFPDIPTVSFEEMRRGDVGLCFGTLFAMPQKPEYPAGYEDWRGAQAQAQSQLEQYYRWQDDGQIVLLHTWDEVQRHRKEWTLEPESPSKAIGVILLMEGADPIKNPDDLERWTKAGVRLIGPAWEATRYAGGTDHPGPLTGMGQELLVGMRELGVILDVSHLDTQAYFQALELQPLAVATHANARALVNTNRQLSDEMIDALGKLEGMIGLVPYNKFLVPEWDRPMPRLEIGALTRHAEHIAEIVGWKRVGIGSDFDGGFGEGEIPLGFSSIRDFERFGDIASNEGARAGVLGGNWLRWLEENF